MTNNFMFWLETTLESQVKCRNIRKPSSDALLSDRIQAQSWQCEFRRVPIARLSGKHIHHPVIEKMFSQRRKEAGNSRDVL